MVLTFPHLGNVYIAAKALFDGLGVEYVVPPMSSRKSLEIGCLYAPEEMCYPFKISLGNYIQSIEKGADTVLITGSCGPCRFGEYCELQMKILKKLGYDVDFIVIDDPSDIGIDELLKRFAKVASGSKKTTSEKIKAAYASIRIMNLIDSVEAKARWLAGCEQNRGECRTLLNSCKNEALNESEPDKVERIIAFYKNRLNNLKLDRTKDPIRISIIGEIYTIIEPFSNLFIEDKLMDLGVSTYRRLTPSWWVKSMLLRPLKLNDIDIKKASRKYIPLCIGGHARECAGEAVLAKKHNFDGAIQVLPMGCMPEIVSKAVLPTISKDFDMPIMTLVVDEMTGEAGYMTRLEAFTDLLERRRSNVLSGS